jgi:hypothetical protein
MPPSEDRPPEARPFFVFVAPYVPRLASVNVAFVG